MSIRIRVYPQPGSIGARRNQAIKRQQQVARLQQQQLIRQQQLLQQQMMIQQQAYGFGGLPGQYGYGSPAGSAYGYPTANSWGNNVGYGSYGYGAAAACPPPYGATGSAFSGASFLPPISQSNYVYQSSSPFGIAQRAGFGGGWFGGW